MVHPVAIEIVVKLVDDVVRCGDIFQFAQHALSAVGDRVGQKQALLLQLDVIGAPCRTQNGYDDAHDREQNDDPNRNDAACAPGGVTAPAEFTELAYGLPPHWCFPRRLASNWGTTYVELLVKGLSRYATAAPNACTLANSGEVPNG